MERGEHTDEMETFLIMGPRLTALSTFLAALAPVPGVQVWPRLRNVLSPLASCKQISGLPKAQDSEMSFDSAELLCRLPHTAHGQEHSVGFIDVRGKEEEGGGDKPGKHAVEKLSPSGHRR